MSVIGDIEHRRTLEELGRYARSSRSAEEKTAADLFQPYKSSRPWFPLFTKQKNNTASLLNQEFWTDEDGNNILSKPDLKYVPLSPIGKFKYAGNITGEEEFEDQRKNPEYDPAQGGLCLDIITFKFGEYLIGGHNGELKFVYRGKSKQFPEFHAFEPFPPLKLWWGTRNNFRWGGDDNPYPEFVRILNLKVEKTRDY